MKMNFSDADGRVLHGLLEDASGDILLRLDRAGFITQASDNASELGMDLASLLLMPHISDFAERDYAQQVEDYVTRALAGDVTSGSVEFPVHSCCGEEDCRGFHTRRWYTLSLRLVDDGRCEPDARSQAGSGSDTNPYSALALLRSVQATRSLEGELNERALTDPLTGLANRHAFCAALRRHLSEGAAPSVAVFAIDRIRAIFMQYGQRTADEIQWGFAKFLETMTHADHELAQLDDERFAVILPDMPIKRARGWAEDVLQTFAGLAGSTSPRAPKLTASAGLARVEMTVDWTLRQAELGLVLARAGGGKQVGICSQVTGVPVSNSGIQRLA